MTEFHHITVLLDEAVEGLNIKANGIYVDATLGGGGHSKRIASHLGSEGHLFSFDQDEMAIRNAENVLQEELDAGKVSLVQDNFRNLKDTLNYFGVDQIDGILYDLGVSSPQLDDGERGFSYHQDAELDMRMDQSQSLTAKTVVNEWSYEDLVRILSRYGEEKFTKRIARAIEAERDKHEILSTLQLAEIIKSAIPAATRRTGGHPAKRSFQAIRIAVNDELGAIEESLDQAIQMLNVGGRVSAISFHSLEDRLIKRMFKQYSTAEEIPADIPLLPDQLPQADYQLVNRKVIEPSQEELDHNNRARSAKLRILERCRI